MTDDLQINMLFVHGQWIGYGRLGVEIAKQLRAQGVQVNDHLEGTEMVDTPTGMSMRLAQSQHLNEGKQSGRSNVVCWVSVPTHGTGWWKGQTAVVFTMWEATRLPESFREALHNFDTIIVPSRQNHTLFSKYHPNVKYVPLGVDPDAWHFQARQKPTRYFRYLIGGSGARKGTDLAVRAFNKLWGEEGSWGDGPVPILQMKNPKAEDYWRRDGRIEMISGRISAEEEIDLYAAAHCYLQPSRGEGFGLQPLQAIAQGCPTILTNAHGHEAFAHLGWGLSTTYAPSSYFIYGDAGDWWEPNFDELCDWMRFIYENYDYACDHAERTSRIARNRFTWERTANGLLDAIGRDRLGPYKGPEEWFTPDVKLYPIVSNSTRIWDIGGTMYHFEAGVEYWVFSDVKRVMFEAGALDPSCLHDDDPKNCGLTDVQVQNAPHYRALSSTCPTCGGPLNREYVEVDEP